MARWMESKKVNSGYFSLSMAAFDRWFSVNWGYLGFTYLDIMVWRASSDWDIISSSTPLLLSISESSIGAAGDR